MPNILIVEGGDLRTALIMGFMLEHQLQRSNPSLKVNTCSRSLAGRDMPTKEEVIEKIKESDIILLDQYLTESYTGEDLLKYCVGKAVIGISAQHRFKDVPNFVCKYALASDAVAVAKLIALVMVAIEGLPK